MSHFSEKPSIESLTQLFLTHYERVKGVAIRYAPARDLIEDVIQQVYAEFIAKSDQWDYDGDFGALLAVMAKNIARRLWRKRLDDLPEVRRRIAEHLQDCAETADESDYNEELWRLRACLASLPEGGQKLIERHYMNGTAVRELAVEMQKEEGTLRKALFRIRMRLRECMERKSGSERMSGRKTE